MVGRSLQEVIESSEALKTFSVSQKGAVQQFCPPHSLIVFFKKVHYLAEFYVVGSRVQYAVPPLLGSIPLLAHLDYV